MDIFFYVLTRRSQPHRTFYAKGVLYGQGVPQKNIVIHYGPECTDYESLDEMKTAFLDVYPVDPKIIEGIKDILQDDSDWNARRFFGCVWGSLACIERFLLSRHSFCYFVQDDFVPVAGVKDIVSDFEKLREYDPNFRILVFNYRRDFIAAQQERPLIREDIKIHRGLVAYGDEGLILDKQGAAYLVDKMKSQVGEPVTILKSIVGTPDGDSFYISSKCTYEQFSMPTKWVTMYP